MEASSDKFKQPPRKQLKIAARQKVAKQREKFSHPGHLSVTHKTAA
jgi:hypothetical protein